VKTIWSCKQNIMWVSLGVPCVESCLSLLFFHLTQSSVYLRNTSEAGMCVHGWVVHADCPSLQCKGRSMLGRCQQKSKILRCPLRCIVQFTYSSLRASGRGTVCFTVECRKYSTHKDIQEFICFCKKKKKKLFICNQNIHFRIFLHPLFTTSFKSNVS